MATGDGATSTWSVRGGDAAADGNGGRPIEGLAEAIHAFTSSCPEWLLTFAPLRQRAVVIRNAHQVVLVDGTLDGPKLEAQVREATDAILHPDRPHPDVTVVDL